MRLVACGLAVAGLCKAVALVAGWLSRQIDDALVWA